MLMEKLYDDAIKIDFESGFHFGSDQQYVAYPSCFATVDFMLKETDPIIDIMDDQRMDLGYEAYLGSYSPTISLNTFNENHIDTCITVIVSDPESEDNGELYTIDLTDEEQKAIYDSLDRQCRKKLSMSCKELLEASEHMMQEGM